MKCGYLLFHQGWTDIINCLSLINYYLNNNYDLIYLIIRADSNKLIDYYVRSFGDKVIVIYVDKSKYLDHANAISYLRENNCNLEHDFLFHGLHDILRKDNYAHKFNSNDFVKSFYVSYGINYNERINSFVLQRDINLENKVYENFIKNYGANYILHHEIKEIENKKNNNINVINLNDKTDIFFDYIKVLENSIEMHLLDSVWAAIVYHIDCKYKLFQNKKIYVYCKRGHNKMYSEPLKLDNWIFL